MIGTIQDPLDRDPDYIDSLRRMGLWTRSFSIARRIYNLAITVSYHWTGIIWSLATAALEERGPTPGKTLQYIIRCIIGAQYIQPQDGPVSIFERIGQIQCQKNIEERKVLNRRSETLVRLSGLDTVLFAQVSTITRCVLAARMQEKRLLKVCCQGKVFRI